MSEAVEAAPSPQAPASDVHSRLKAFLGGPESSAASGDSPAEDGGATVQVHPKATADESPSAPSESEPVPKDASAPEDRETDSVDEPSDDAQSEQRQFSNLPELLEAGGFDLDKGMDLEFPVKIDGKEGTAKLRDLVKSYQLDGHINQKLQSVDTDRKALMAEQQRFQAERADKLLKLDAGVKTLERVLLGEFQQVEWDKLAAEDPAAYDSKFREFHQRNAYLVDIGKQIAEEQQQFQARHQAEYAAKLAEEKRLMLAKIPEWGNETARVKDKADISAHLESAYGITKNEFEAIDDHRYALVARDAWKWGQLQKSKPALLNKVKAAPKLLKPGTQQSKDAVQRAAQDKDRARLRQTGKTQDAVPALRRMLFG